MFGKLLQPEAIFYSKYTKSVWRPARGAYSGPPVSQIPQLDLRGPLRGWEGQRKEGREETEGEKERRDHPYHQFLDPPL